MCLQGEVSLSGRAVLFLCIVCILAVEALFIYSQIK
jgi:hypothetical protein